MKNKLISRKTTQLILVHFTGSQETDYRQIRAESLQKGILEIGYHYLIEADGKLLMGRHQSKVGFHHPEFDVISIGIGVAAERDNMSDEQSIALTLLLDKLQNDYPSVEKIKYIYRAPC